MKTNILTPEQKVVAQDILTHLQSAETVLMHCHPSPDPDSLGSVLATKFALEAMGKKVTVIAGDSKIPEAFNHMPGVLDVLPQNYFETDLTQFDTYISLDSSSFDMISRKDKVVFPPQSNPELKVIVIDHHATNVGYGNINLVATQYISTTEILFDLFQEWNVTLTKDIAANLYAGLFTDSGGFRYNKTTDHSFYMAGTLYDINPQILDIVVVFDNSSAPAAIDFLGLALTQKKVFEGAPGKGSFVISYVTQEDIKRLGLTSDDWSGNVVSSILKSVVGWNVTAFLIEEAQDVSKCSFRTRDQVEFDVSKVAVALGGGGHKAAAGATVKKPILEAVDEVARVIKETLFS